jgi:hypothetical protein
MTRKHEDASASAERFAHRLGADARAMLTLIPACLHHARQLTLLRSKASIRSRHCCAFPESPFLLIDSFLTDNAGEHEAAEDSVEGGRIERLRIHVHGH